MDEFIRTKYFCYAKHFAERADMEYSYGFPKLNIFLVVFLSWEEPLPVSDNRFNRNPFAEKPSHKSLRSIMDFLKPLLKEPTAREGTDSILFQELVKKDSRQFEGSMSDCVSAISNREN